VRFSRFVPQGGKNGEFIFKFRLFTRDFRDSK
jgi:hypothetical protein